MQTCSKKLYWNRQHTRVAPTARQEERNNTNIVRQHNNTALFQDMDNTPVIPSVCNEIDDSKKVLSKVTSEVKGNPNNSPMRYD